MSKKEDYEKIKADLPRCELRNCDRIGIITADVSMTENTGYAGNGGTYCCKTHMLRDLSKTKMPRYSKNAWQRLATTMGLFQKEKE